MKFVYLTTIFIVGAMIAFTNRTVLASTITESEIDSNEWALLPPYCRHTQGFSGHTPANRARWEPLMGKRNFSSMHHYCWALIRLHRAEKAATPRVQKGYLRANALNDFDYVLRNTSEDFVLLPELLTWIGRTELLIDKPGDADKAFAKARDIKPDYWPAYTHWAEYLRATGRKNDAMVIVKTGLQHAPTAKVLHELFRTLGGRPEDIPPPIIKQEDSPAQQQPDAEQPKNGE